MKKFEAPEIDIHALLVTDVITTSGESSGGIGFDDNNIGPIT